MARNSDRQGCATTEASFSRVAFSENLDDTNGNPGAVQLRQLCLGGIDDVLETRLLQAQAEVMAPIDLISCLVSDELERRGIRLLERRRKQA